MELLREYAANNSEAAFAALVSRHINLVHAVAMRQTGNPQHAEEITQAVFIILARKAGALKSGTVLSGWLFHTARLTAANFVRTEMRRAQREQEAYMQSTLQETGGDDAWRRMAPLLDGAMAKLGEKDRNAIVLRFIEGKELEEVGTALGTSEAAAQRRVHRAVEKLRKFFTKRGVILSGTILASAMAANAAPAAPAALTSTVTTAAALKGATAGASTLALIKGTLKLMAWTKIKMAAVAGAALLLVVGGGITLAQMRQGPETSTAADGITAAELVKKVQDKYASLTSYRDTGTSAQEGYSSGPIKWNFDIRLGRPNYYRLESRMQAMPAMKAAAWSTGEGDFAMPLTGNKYFKETKPSLALAVAAAASDVPLIFFGGGPSQLLRGKNISRSQDEQIGGIDCRVLVNETLLRENSSITGTNTATIWVGKEDDLIHQWRMVVKVSPKSGRAADIVVTETHENIVVNEPVKKEDFAYEVPEGKVLSELPKPAGQTQR